MVSLFMRKEVRTSVDVTLYATAGAAASWAKGKPSRGIIEVLSSAPRPQAGPAQLPGEALSQRLSAIAARGRCRVLVSLLWSPAP